MDIQAVYFDIDGTLLYGYQDIGEEVYQAICEYKEKGGMLGIATGRSWLAGRDWNDKLKPNLPSIYLNGSLIMDQGMVVLKRPLPYNLYIGVKEQLAHHFYIVEEYIDHYCAYTPLERRLFLAGFPISGDSIKIGSNSEDRDVLVLHCMNRRQGEPVDFRKFYLPKGYPRSHIRVVQQNKYWYQVSMHSDKSDGLDYLQKYNVPPERIAFFGNGDNDIGLLKKVGFRVVMKNGSPNAIALADRVIHYNEIPDVLALF